jgi:murein DD-endopeptidase MepM/ murein hydrolase activator NlpD
MLPVTNENTVVSLWFHNLALKMKAIAGVGIMALCCAAMPVHAGTIPNDDDPYSDDLTEIPQPAVAGTTGSTDTTFASLFSSWQRMDAAGAPQQSQTLFIPSGRPVVRLELTSNYGVRSDPFNGHARMHKGIDIPGPVGTPVYATADGIVSRSERVGGYGNLVAIAHGNDMETRYGHLSRLLVSANERVRRGQLIGLMGSTGRSTGSHLHYEIRIAGNAINPLPFVTGSERAMALNSTPPVAMGGPRASDEAKIK